MTVGIHEAGRPPAGLQPCPYRRMTADVGDRVSMSCDFVRVFLGLADSRLCHIHADTCRACSTCLHADHEVNPVKASLIHRVAGEIEETGGVPECSPARASTVRRRIVHQLASVRAGRPDFVFPPGRSSRSGGEVLTDSTAGEGERTNKTWMVGMLTAPRSNPTLVQSLSSFEAAGFGGIHLFAEPGTEINEHPVLASVTRSQRRLGNLANFLTALGELYERCDTADCYAVFQDDVIAATGLRHWCDRELWPDGHGLVSLFTPRIHASATSGWHVQHPGFYRVHGAQALVFRCDVLEAFLSDHHVAGQMHVQRHGDDAVVSGWATRRRLGIAYHTPSPTQHIGQFSSIYPAGHDPLNLADFAADTREFPRWTAPSRRRARIGLVGWNVNTGLGQVNRDLVQHLDFDRWIIPRCPYRPTLPAPKLPRRIEFVGRHLSRTEQLRLLDGLDWLVFAERPYLSGILHTARALGVRLACIPMWEWLDPQEDWLQLVDLMICPTRHTFRHLIDWRERYSFGFDLVEMAWPLDLSRFRFRRRRQCRSVLYVNGLGGGQGMRPDGTATPYGRKGLETILAAARRARHHRFEVLSLVQIAQTLPPNVTLHQTPASHVDLYREGDVCVQPSTWEGIGLQLLECQASGMPLITTDAAPMNEYEPLEVIPVEKREVVFLSGQPILSHVPSVDGLIEILDRLAATDITDASFHAREFMEREHNWDRARGELEQQLAV